FQLWLQLPPGCRNDAQRLLVLGLIGGIGLAASRLLHGSILEVDGLLQVVVGGGVLLGALGGVRLRLSRLQIRAAEVVPNHILVGNHVGCFLIGGDGLGIIRRLRLHQCRRRIQLFIYRFDRGVELLSLVCLGLLLLDLLRSHALFLGGGLNVLFLDLLQIDIVREVVHGHVDVFLLVQNLVVFGKGDGVLAWLYAEREVLSFFVGFQFVAAPVVLVLPEHLRINNRCSLSIFNFAVNGAVGRSLGGSEARKDGAEKRYRS